MSIDSPDRDLRPRATKRATMLFPGRNRDTLRDCEESEKCGGSLFWSPRLPCGTVRISGIIVQRSRRRTSFASFASLSAGSSRGHGKGLTSLSSHLSQGDRPCCCHPTSRNPGWSTSWRKPGGSSPALELVRSPSHADQRVQVPPQRRESPRGRSADAGLGRLLCEGPARYLFSVPFQHRTASVSL